MSFGIFGKSELIFFRSKNYNSRGFVYVYPLKTANLPGDLKSAIIGDLKSPIGDFRSPGELEIQLGGRWLGQWLGNGADIVVCKS